ncbi:hypothetical protein P9112_009069 [Eukaryota sp. TZLM1-RC]
MSNGTDQHCRTMQLFEQLSQVVADGNADKLSQLLASRFSVNQSTSLFNLCTLLLHTLITEPGMTIETYKHCIDVIEQCVSLHPMVDSSLMKKVTVLLDHCIMVSQLDCFPQVEMQFFSMNFDIDFIKVPTAFQTAILEIACKYAQIYSDNHLEAYLPLSRHGMSELIKKVRHMNQMKPIKASSNSWVQKCRDEDEFPRGVADTYSDLDEFIVPS